MTGDEREERLKAWRDYRQERVLEIVETEDQLITKNIAIRRALSDEALDPPLARKLLLDVYQANCMDSLIVTRNVEFLKTIMLCRRYAFSKDVRKAANLIYRQIHACYVHEPGVLLEQQIYDDILDMERMKVVLREVFAGESPLQLQLKLLAQQLNERELSYPPMTRGDELPDEYIDRFEFLIRADADDAVEYFADDRPMNAFDPDFDLIVPKSKKQPTNEEPPKSQEQNVPS